MELGYRQVFWYVYLPRYVVYVGSCSSHDVESRILPILLAFFEEPCPAHAGCSASQDPLAPGCRVAGGLGNDLSDDVNSYAKYNCGSF